MDTEDNKNVDSEKQAQGDENLLKESWLISAANDIHCTPQEMLDIVRASGMI